MPTALDELFQNVPQLPSLPRAVTDLIDSLGKEDANIDNVVDNLSHDPNLSARVLRIANSSFYGASRKVGAIDDAIAMIGLNALRTLVIASGVSSAFKNIPHVDLKAFWQNALVVAGLAKRIARRTRGKVNPEFAYTAGLMYRMGVLMIHAAFPTAAATIASECKDITVGERNAIERNNLRVCHAQVGERLATNWRFPEEIVTALRWYADPADGKASDTARVVTLAAQIALDNVHGRQTDEIAAHLPQSALTALEISADELIDDIASVADMQRDAASFI